MEIKNKLIKLRKDNKFSGMKDIGDKIRMERERKNLSQKELAEILGVKQNTISQYETNTKRPSYEMLDALANYFDVTVDYLLSREE